MAQSARFSFLAENRKVITRFIITFFFIGMGTWFIKHEQSELQEVQSLLITAQWQWLMTGILLTGIYVLMNGLMYMSSFAAVGSKVQLSDAVTLFLKRNLVSIFLPAGGVSSLAFFSKDIENKGINKSQINFASSVYGFVGILTVIILAIPAFSYAFFAATLGLSEGLGLVTVIFLIALLYSCYRSIYNKGQAYNYIKKKIPSIKVILDEISANKIVKRSFIITILFSLLIEFLGVAHLYVAMRALHVQSDLLIALLGYLIAVVFMIISPFLRGMGAVELSMAYLLTRFGFNTLQAISITFLYRFFEFWLPLLAGLFSFLRPVNKLLMRIIPALLLFSLGIINIISVLTPALSVRLSRLEDLLPIEAINASNYFVFLAGLLLLITSAFMLKGLRVAWHFAIGLSLASIIGHLTKAIDYEEALVSLIVLLILLLTRKEYYVKPDPRMLNFGIQTTLLTMLAIIIYGITGFYFLDVKHFNANFTVPQAIQYTLRNFLLVGNDGLVPLDRFARIFLFTINISGFLSMIFFIYTILRPYVFKKSTDQQELQKARALVSQYGQSSMDYFKVYGDKLIFMPADLHSFLAYRVSGNFAVVLEDPVAPSANEMKDCIRAFEQFCSRNSLKSLYYRVPEKSLPFYLELGKKKLFIGQEGVVDLLSFSLEGGDKKSLRNGLKKITEKAFSCRAYQPPINDGLLQKIKAVSDDWLKETGREEIIFSQGDFNWLELKDQVIMTVENPEEKVVAFLNVIPDYAPGEGTYDLVRKTGDAPPGTIDFLIIELFKYLKTEGYKSANLGFAPLTGHIHPHNLPERSIKLASEKIRSFARYRSLRDFKEKFKSFWHNQYLVYEQDYDLLQVPGVLARIIKP